jgi:hypothetical protein
MKMPGNPRGRVELDAMTLAVIERERVAFEVIANSHSETGGGIQTSAEEANGFHALPQCKAGVQRQE